MLMIDFGKLGLGLGLLGVNASATARVISRRWNDDDEISYLVEEASWVMIYKYQWLTLLSWMMI